MGTFNRTLFIYGCFCAPMCTKHHFLHHGHRPFQYCKSLKGEGLSTSILQLMKQDSTLLSFLHLSPLALLDNINYSPTTLNVFFSSSCFSRHSYIYTHFTCAGDYCTAMQSGVDWFNVCTAPVGRCPRPPDCGAPPA